MNSSIKIESINQPTMFKYFNRLIVFGSLLLVPPFGYGQSLERTVIGDLGGFAAPIGGPSLSQNMGETIVASVSSGSYLLTQGFEQPTFLSISGSATFCFGVIDSMIGSPSGGRWSVSNIVVATVDSITGVVTGVESGTDTVTYTLSGLIATMVVTVNPLPHAGVITGPSTLCLGDSSTLTDSIPGGIWTISNNHATISSIGHIIGISSGVDTISYTVTNLFGSATVQKIITVNPLPNTGTISGSSTVCAGANITLTATASGGTWSASNSNAIVSSGGVVTGMFAGPDTIRYTVSNSCGSSTASMALTVNPMPNAGSITGLSAVCVGAEIALSETAAGGYWTVNNVHASISSSGIVYGVTTGLDTVSYFVTNSCGNASTAKIITVSPLPSAGVLAGISTLCQDDSTSLSGFVPGGVWAASNGSATVASGNIHGITPGVDTIMYSVSNSCGSSLSTFIVTINPLPVAGTINGLSSVCQGSSLWLSDSLSGGSWSSTNTTTVVSAAGEVYGIMPGVDTVNYSVTTSCGISSVTKIITVNPLPTGGSIIGSSTLCQGATTTFAETASGGVWASSDSALASISTGGVLFGNSAGSVIISYAVTNSCGNAIEYQNVTVNTLPHVDSILGSDFVCVGNTADLADSVLGGSWTSSNGNAFISSTGLIYGYSDGLDTITYTVTNICGETESQLVITVSPLPNAGLISGVSVLCIGSSSTLLDSVSGGLWSASNGELNITGGVITGASTGLDTVYYSYSNACGTDITSKIIAVLSNPSVTTIAGSSTVCVGSTISLTDSLLGGAWSTTNANAGVSSIGIVYGLSVGTDTVKYSATNSCGSDSATTNVTVIGSPTVGNIIGGNKLCVGSVITLSDSTPGGTWTTTNNRATIDSVGILTAVSTGLDTIEYSVANLCGMSVSTTSVLVQSVPGAGEIMGRDTVCMTGTISLTDTVSGGVWSCTNGKATVSPDGVVTGVGYGRDTVQYTVTNSCGSANVSFPIFVNQPGECNASVDMVAGAGNHSVIIFPNPNEGEFSINIQSATDEIADVTVSNILGQQIGVYHMKTNRDLKLSISSAPGTYLLGITTSLGRESVKVVVLRDHGF